MDVPRRFSEHAAGGKKAARAVRGKGPLKLVFCREIGSRSAALKAEAALKNLPKSVKEDLISGQADFQSLINF